MTTREFIFSRRRNIVFLRHFTFWFLWICYFSVETITFRWMSVPHSKLVGFAFFTVTSTTWGDMLYCYLIIYVLLPRYFFKGYFLKFFMGWLAWTFIVSICFRYVSIASISLGCQLFGLPKRPQAPFIVAFFSNFGLFGFEGCVATAIVLGKNWFFNNQSLLALKSNRNGNSQLLRAQQHLLLPFAIIRYQLKQLMRTEPVLPGHAADDNASSLQQQNMSDTLQLAEQVMEHAQFTRIALADELETVTQYLAARKQEYPKLLYSIHSPVTGLYILPNLLLSLTHIPFAATQNDGGSDFQLTISTKETKLLYDFSWTGTDAFSLPEAGQYDGLRSLQKLLNFYYYENFSLELEKATDGMRLQLTLQLTEKPA